MHVLRFRLGAGGGNAFLHSAQTGEDAAITKGALGGLAGAFGSGSGVGHGKKFCEAGRVAESSRPVKAASPGKQSGDAKNYALRPKCGCSLRFFRTVRATLFNKYPSQAAADALQTTQPANGHAALVQLNVPSAKRTAREVEPV